MKTEFPRLIQDLSVNLQQPLLEPVEDACRISWDELELFIYLHEHEGEEILILNMEFYDMPFAAEEKLATLMLQANYLWIGTEYSTLSMNSESRKLALCQRLSMQTIEVEALTNCVKTMYQVAINWRDIVAEQAMNSGAANDIPNNGDDYGMFV